MVIEAYVIDFCSDNTDLIELFKIGGNENTWKVE